MNFIYPAAFWAMIPCVLMIAMLLLKNKNSDLVAPHIAKAMGYIQHRNRKLLALISTSLFVGIFAIAGPSLSEQERPSIEGNEARVIILDLSQSMYARDVPPSRVEQARFKIADLLDKWADGQTGLVAFSADAYSITPLTSDLKALKSKLPLLSPDIMPFAGSNASSGISLAVEMLNNAGYESGQLVLITDDLTEQESDKIEALIGDRWSLAILGVATEKGAPIPASDATNGESQSQESWLLDAQGNPIVATSNFSMLTQLANRTNGLFIPVQVNDSDIDVIANMRQYFQDLGQEQRQRDVDTMQNQGFWLVLPLLALSLLLFRRGSMFAVVIAVSFIQSPNAEASIWLNPDQQGYQAFEAGEYTSAQDTFEDAHWRGIAAYKAGDFAAAIRALKLVDTPDAIYNLGNAYAQSGYYPEAIEQYKRVVELEAKHANAQYNLNLLTKLQQQMQSEESQNSEPDEEKPQPEQKEKSEAVEPDGEQPSTEGLENGREHNDANDKDSSPEDPSAQDDGASRREADPNSEQPASDDEEPAPRVELVSQTESDLRRLEQIEASRDPAKLLRAQIQLQANKKPEPQVTEKIW